MILDSFCLDGKVALVTGATRGLGQGCALALAQAGADIAGLHNSPIAETAQAVDDLGRRFLPVHCDLRTAPVEQLRAIVSDVVAQLGRLDILVNNAGIIRRTPAVDFGEQDWDDVLHVDLRALFFLSQAAARAMMRQGGGKIINIASVLSFQGGVLVPAYTAAKSGVAGLTRALANEWAGHNINVNAIAPGYMVTDNTAPIRADAARNRAILERIPAGRWGTPGDLQGVVVFLASAASDYMHGAIVPVDGGWLAR
ncbi:MAG TPA: 2-dehydro-3-deoxy-D-gluconate 5-dehydrogenase KduD [Anaerolineae bacterium]|nr:2-dehydro-3-deoxy-D-gluconate 5-dehydrogenase KduD [Anaerolineae bacterium]HOQ99944.1 2-dehydro-3-deoxy-D-gluconate 5-dehydrogenase KduD [Anaerolineae bacterium]